MDFVFRFLSDHIFNCSEPIFVMRCHFLAKVLFVLYFGSGIQAELLKVVDKQAIFDNGYVSASIDLSGGAWVNKLFGDYLGKSNYGNNLFALNGLRLERENSDGSVTSAAGKGSNAKYSVSSDGKCAQLVILSVVDDVLFPIVNEDWNLSLCVGDRFFTFTTNGTTTPVAKDMRSIRHSLYATPISTTGFFDSGVVQILAAGKAVSHFGSVDKISRAFFLGETGSVDIVRLSAVGGENDQVVLLNADADVNSFRSGLQDILVGNFTKRDIWTQGSSSDDITVCTVTKVFSIVWSFLFRRP